MAAGQNPTTYALVGALVTALFSLAALLLKYLLDARAEARKQSFELEKLSIQTRAAQVDRRQEQTLDCFVRFLGSTHEVYRQVVQARRNKRATGDEDAYRTALQTIDPREAQAGLDELRIVASDHDLRDASAQLWTHLRSSQVAQAVDTGAHSWVEWKAEYWQRRDDLLRTAHLRLGADVSAAGQDPAR